MRITNRGISDPLILKQIYGIRFHHFLTKAGRLIATIATEPLEGDENTVSVACAVCSPNDAPSRARGRQIAVGRLETGACIDFDISVLKEAITDRSILAYFIDDATAKRLGYYDETVLNVDTPFGNRVIIEKEGSVGNLIADIRERLPFVPKSE